MRSIRARLEKLEKAAAQQVQREVVFKFHGDPDLERYIADHPDEEVIVIQFVKPKELMEMDLE